MVSFMPSNSAVPQVKNLIENSPSNYAASLSPNINPSERHKVKGNPHEWITTTVRILDNPVA